MYLLNTILILFYREFIEIVIEYYVENWYNGMCIRVYSFCYAPLWGKFNQHFRVLCSIRNYKSFEFSKVMSCSRDPDTYKKEG